MINKCPYCGLEAGYYYIKNRILYYFCAFSDSTTDNNMAKMHWVKKKYCKNCDKDITKHMEEPGEVDTNSN